MSQASNEANRLIPLRALAIKQPPDEPDLDAICRLTHDLFDVPLALVSVIEDSRQSVKARCGVSQGLEPDSLAFRRHTALSDKALVIEDIWLDPRFAGQPLVRSAPGIRFYAGMPLTLRPGIRIGTVCIVDTTPRTFGAEQIRQLRDIAKIVLAQLRFHETARAHATGLKQYSRLSGDLDETRNLLHTILENMDQGLILYGHDMRVRLHNRRAREILDLPENVLREGNADSIIDAYQTARGDLSVPSHQLPALEAGALERPSDNDQRQRPDGTSLEIRNVQLAGGGHMRTYTDTTRHSQSERIARESEARYRVLADAASDMIVRRTTDGRCTYVSPASQDLLGYTAEEMQILQLAAVIHPDDRQRANELRQTLKTGKTDRGRVSYRLKHRDGRWIWVEARSRLVRDESGLPVETVTAVRDITERVAAEEALRDSEERLSLALESGSDGLWDWCLASHTMTCSRHWFGMLGYAVGEITVDPSLWRRLVHPDDVREALRLLVAHLRGTTPLFEHEYRLRKTDGSYLWTLVRGRVVSRDPAGRPQRMVGTHIDIDRRKIAEQQIAHLAAHDALTGLPNRVLFRDRLGHELATVRRHGGDVAVLECDLDRFKEINDTLGHPAGDALLCIIADRLNAVVREVDTVARLGGDEFALVLAHPAGAQVGAVAQRIIDTVGRPVELDGHLTQVGVTIGIALVSQDSPDLPGQAGVNADGLFKNADIALYHAKASGRNTYRFYEPGMDAKVVSRNLLERDLRAALQQGGITLHYQPVMRLVDDVTGGFEALMRWQHPTRGPISPGEFIPLAEETGLIVPLGTFALREACREAAGWPDKLRVAVNVSAVQFQQPGLEQTVVGALAAAGLAPDRLELEITESVLMEDSEAALVCLHRLRGIGVRIALDDFGTGYSSLSYLRRFPFDKIKIDRTFVRDIADLDTAAIVHAIVGIGKQLGTAITAEGVETPEQLAAVRRAGCTEVQGFFYSKPLSAAGALDWLGHL